MKPSDFAAAAAAAAGTRSASDEGPAAAAGSRSAPVRAFAAAAAAAAAGEPRPVAVVEIDTVFQAVGAYRVLQNGTFEPGCPRYEALVQQANRIVAEALERVRAAHGYAHIMVAPLVHGPHPTGVPDVTARVVSEIRVVEALAWQRRRTSRRPPRVA